MKRWISWILALSLILCAAVLPAVAEEEETKTDAVTSASVSRKEKDGRKNIPGGQTQESRKHGRKEQQPDSSQTQTEESENLPDFIPDDPDGETVSPDETPESSRPSGKDDKESASESRKEKDLRDPRTGKRRKTESTDISGQITFELLLEKGVISQEVYDAIMEFIREYTAAMTESAPEIPAAEDAAST